MEDFVRIYGRAYEGLEEYAYTTRKEIKSYFRWLRKRDSEGMFVAVDDSTEEVVGFVACDTNWYSSFEEKEVGEIHELFVEPEWRGKGVGKALLEKGIEYARLKGRDLTELWVGEKNYKAREFYEKMGFKAAGSWGHWIRMVKRI